MVGQRSAQLRTQDCEASFLAIGHGSDGVLRAVLAGWLSTAGNGWQVLKINAENGTPVD